MRASGVGVWGRRGRFERNRHTAAAAATVRIPSASRASHALKRAYILDTGPTPAETRMHRVSPLRNTSSVPPSEYLHTNGRARMV